MGTLMAAAILPAAALLLVQRTAVSVSALPYSSYISLAKATSGHQTLVSEGGDALATAPGTAAAANETLADGNNADYGSFAAVSEFSIDDERLELEQREMLRQAIKLVEPYHHHYYHEDRDDEMHTEHHSGSGGTQPIVIRDISPSSGPVGGGTTVEIIAEVDEDTAVGPLIGRRLSCRFDIVNIADAVDATESDQANTSISNLFVASSWLTEATVQSPTRLACPSPKVDRPMTTRVSLVDATTGHVVAIARPSVSTAFVHYEEPAVVRLEPKEGPLRGGTVVRTSLAGYAVSARLDHDIDRDEVLCRFGNAVVNATLIEAESMVECASPPAPRLDATPLVGASFDAPFAISMNGGSDYSTSTLTFAYHGDIRVRSIEPARGSALGGTVVVITGENIHLASDCAFGEMESAYSYRDHEVDGLHCVTLAVEGPQRVELRLKTAQGWLKTGMQFVFEKEKARQTQLSVQERSESTQFPISILGISPALGPSTGGTNVTIALNTAGRSLDNATVLCWFDDAVMIAEVLVDGNVSCLTAPTFINHGTKIARSNLTVSVNGIISNGILQFTYYQLRRSDIVALTPSTVDAKGGTMVRVDFGSVSLMEILQSNNLLGDIVVRVGRLGMIPATYDNASEHLTFFAQRIEELDAATILDVSISLNGGADFTLAPSLQVHPTPELFSISPSIVQLGRNETVEIIGSNFIAFENAVCKIGDTVTRAVVISSSVLECALPEVIVAGRALPGTMPVTISLNRIDFVQEVLSINVEVGIIVESLLSPYASEIGGTNVTLIGRNLHLMGRGFIALGSEGMRAVPHMVNETHAIFAAPAGKGEMGLSLALDHGSVLTETGLSLQYLPPLTIEEVQPPFCAVSDGCSLQFTGSTFDTTFDYTCEVEAINGLSVASGNVSIAGENSAACELSPSSVLGSTFIHILRTSDGERSNPIPFVFTDVLTLTSVHPTNITELGGSVVVAGRGFDEQFNLICTIETFDRGQGKQSNTTGHWLSSTEIECPLRPMPVGSASIRIIEDSVVAKSNPLHLSVHPAARLLGAAPLLGKRKGGTKVLVEVRALESDDGELLCSFGDRTSQFRFLNNTHGVCMSPPGQVGTSQVEFSILRESITPSGRRLKQAAGMPSQGIIFTYRDPPKILNVIPREGPASGGTKVQILTDSSDSPSSAGALTLRLTSRSSSSRVGFVREVASGTDGNLSVALPPSPDGGKGGTSVIELSLNGQEYEYGGATFTFTPSMYIDKISPLLVPSLSEFGIAIFGENFGNVTRPLWCRVGGITKDAMWVSSGMVVCSTPKSLAPGSYNLELSSNNIDYVYSPNDLRVRPEIQVIDASPLMGPIRGGSEVTVRGKNFEASDEAFNCVFGGEEVEAVILNDTQIHCKVPPRAIPETLSFALSIDRSHYSYFAESQVQSTSDVLDANHLFQYYADEVIEGVEPNLGPARGGTVVSVRGRNFQGIPSLSCKIGTSIVLAVFQNSEHVLCTVPPMLEVFGHDDGLNHDGSLASTWITVSNNGIDWLDTGFQAPASFSFYVEPRFIGLYPSIVPPEGKIPVQIMIDGPVVDGYDAFVQVADFILPAATSHRAITFDAPLLEVGKAASVRVSFNSVDFSSDALELRYLDTPILYKIGPRVGPAWGLNTVTLFDRNFDSTTNMHVEFGSAVVSATILSDRRAVCTAPANEIGKVNVRLLYGENSRLPEKVEGNDDDETTYEYLRAVILDTATPRSGPTRGSTNVVISGSDFPLIEDGLFCLFGEALSPAKWLSINRITCSSPPVIDAADVAVNVGVVGADDEFVPLSQSAIQFRYYEEPSFSGIYPDRGLAEGGSIVKIALNESSFLHDSTHCQFGNAIVLGERLGDGMVTCAVPRRGAGGSVNVAVSMNNQDYHHVGNFHYHEIPSVLSVSPSHGRRQGGTQVAISGVGFLPPDEQHEGLVCDFGGRQVVATFVDSHLVECSAPANIVSIVKPTVIYVPRADEASIRAESNSTFEYVDEVEVAKAFPTILPSSAYSGTGYLEVHGSNFRGDEASCRFHLLLPSNSTMSENRELIFETSSTFINMSYVRCGPGVPGLDAFFAPGDSLEGMLNDPAIVDRSLVELSVTTNGQEYSDAFTLLFAADPVVESIFPALGAVTGGTEVIVQGEQFMLTPTLQCRFGIKVVDALFASENELICRSPAVRMSATVPVEISVNGRDFSSDGTTFRYHEALYLETATPNLSPSIGGVTVAIVMGGCSVDEDMPIVCRFNSTHIDATVINESTISCKSPAANANGGTVPLSVSLNGGVDFIGGLDFLYTPGQKSEAMSLSPSHGPERGGSRVVVSGLAGFGSADAIADMEGLNGICRFGKVVVPATHISKDGTSMVCTSPPKQDESVAWVPVDVAYLPTKEALTSTNVIFIYDDNVDLHELWPTTGPLSGHTPVSIQGGPFVRDLSESGEILCRFGEQIVPGKWHSKGEVGCVAPPVGDGSESMIVDVSVAINGQDFSESLLQYTYHPLVIVNELSPNHGPISGGTVVTIHGEHFEPSSDLACWFGETPVTPLDMKNSTRLTCRAPPALRPGGVEVHVSLNGFIPSYKVSIFSRIYHFEEVLGINAVHPPFGPSRGGSSIVVSGGPFANHSDSEEMFCRFGEMKPVPAKFLSPLQILCVTPPHLPEIVTLQVTQNAQDYSPGHFAFEYYPNEIIHRLHPNFGPRSGGHSVRIHGENFRNDSLTTCRFDDDVQVSAIFVDTTEIQCESPSLDSSELQWKGLGDIPLNVRDGTAMFPTGHGYPSYLGRAVAVEVSNNRLDFTDQSIQYWSYEDVELSSLSATTGPYWGGTPIFMTGSNFINSTSLSCRIGAWKTRAQYLDRTSALCVTPPQALVEADVDLVELHGTPIRPPGSLPSTAYVSLSNNGLDFTNPLVYQYEEASSPGSYQPSITSSSALRCPRGAFCLGGSSNFTLCFEGTYQPLMGQDECLECPVGYHCPEVGMIQPRICPAGRVCSETGLGRKLAPCPTGHLCGLGTATLETTCSIRRSGCFDNSTDDFGLQFGNDPGRFWSERHLLPLDTRSPVLPNRGRYCLDDTCMRLEDELDLAVSDRSFAYSSIGFNLRRPVPCRAGEYCGPGEAMNETSHERLSSPQLCFDSNYCPEGSTNPRGTGDCPRGHYCSGGQRLPCPIGTFCPTGVSTPKPCRPGFFTFLVGQEKCSECPQGYYCPNYGRIEPAICPPGMVCSKPGLASPNLRCPAGFYCQNGTITSDPFRNDTTLRPYACQPGSYCLDGTGYDAILEGDFLYAQPCQAGFYCGAASTSAVGMRPCPKGFYCPKGTSTPRHAPKGHVAEYLGTIEAAACLPGTYAPTIQSDMCYPCPPGTRCETEGLTSPAICGPGQYKDATDPEVECVDCPQGTWSKNWHLREKSECVRLPTGVIGPIEGSTSPCSKQDLPTPYEPVVNADGIPAYEYEHPLSPPFSIDECLRLNPSFAEGKRIQNQEYFYGELIPPYTDILGRGPHFRSTDDQNLLYATKGRCYKNSQPDGSVLFNRMKDYYGPQIDIQFGRGGMSTRQFSILATVYRLWSCTGGIGK